MRFANLIGPVLVILLTSGSTALAEPPKHAPAHGHRAKHAAQPKHDGGVSVRFDSGLGIHVAVDLPGVFLHDGRYYRHTSSGWQLSLRGDGGWSVVGAHAVPGLVLKTRGGPPAKAGHPKHRKKARGKKK